MVRLPDPQDRGGTVDYVEAIVCVTIVVLIGVYFSGEAAIPKWAVVLALLFAYRFGNLAQSLQNPEPKEHPEEVSDR